jgi:outer membrane protein OmpA-like peptidoglycan-associated protein
VKSLPFLAPAFALVALLGCGTSPLYQKTYEQETQRLENQAAAEREEAGRYAAVVYFDVGSSTIKPEGYQELDWFVEKVSVDPTAGIHVRGFADATGGDSVNQRLSYERAQSVASYLVSKGIPPSRLAPLGFSSEFPAASNETTAGRRSNRRVEVTVR